MLIQAMGCIAILLSMSALPLGAQDRGAEGRAGQSNPPQRGANERFEKGGGGGLKSRGPAAARLGEIERARLERVMEFVEANQPQLLRLVNALEKNNPAQHRLAIMALSREIERLNQLKQTNAERFPNALEMWKNQKSLDLVSAQVATQGETEELRAKMRELLQERRRLMAESLEFDIKAVQARLNRLERTKSELQSQDDDLEQRIDQLIQRAKRSGTGSPMRPGFGRGPGKDRESSPPGNFSNQGASDDDQD